MAAAQQLSVGSILSVISLANIVLKFSDKSYILFLLSFFDIFISNAPISNSLFKSWLCPEMDLPVFFIKSNEAIGPCSKIS